MNPDPNAIELDSSWGTPGNPTRDAPIEQFQRHIHGHLDVDPLLVWTASGNHLISGLLGMNTVLLGAALVASQAFNSSGLKHQEPQVFILLLMVVSLVWILWYLLWARKQPGISPHKDHHAGGITVTVVILFFAACSLLLFICRTGYLITMRECKASVTVLTSFLEAPFLALQTYLLWAHSKDCIQRHKTITSSGLMMILSADLLLWLNAVTDDTIHEEIELERGRNSSLSEADLSDLAETANSTICQCSTSPSCLIFRKCFEILYPFNMEYYLMAGCMIYVMWKNVGRRMSPGHHHAAQKITLHIVYQGGVIYGLLFGGLVLIAGVAVFILYQVWVGHPQLRPAAFFLFYGYHLALLPVISLCSLAGLLVHRLERRAHEGGHNPTRSLDVLLLVAAAVGQLSLSYFSLIAALAMGTQGQLGDLDLCYSLLSLLELLLQNIFIIRGLHRHPSLLMAKKKEKEQSSIFKPKKKAIVPILEEGKTSVSLLETSSPPAVPEQDKDMAWTKRAIQEICAFLILSNIMLWVIPAFGVHPQFENGLGKEFFGFSVWFVLVNLGQPLGVFYRMHSVGALMELFISA